MEEGTQNLRKLRVEMRALQAELIGKLELEVVMLRACLERSEKRLVHERTLMQLTARGDAGLLSAEEQQQMYGMMRAILDEEERRKATQVSI